MFDVGFSEIVVIAVVALVVIGPERLPTVARTLGALMGRLNRYVADVKADVEREMRLEEMKKLRAEVEQQAMGIEQSVVKELEAARTAVEQPASDAQASLADVMRETNQTGVEIQQALSEPTAAMSPLAEATGDVQKSVTDAAQTPRASVSATEIVAAPSSDPFNDPAPEPIRSNASATAEPVKQA